MACNSEYMEPRLDEVNRKKISSLIIFVNQKLDVKTHPGAPVNQTLNPN